MLFGHKTRNTKYAVLVIMILFVLCPVINILSQEAIEESGEKKEYQIRQGDRLHIAIYPQSEFDADVEVDNKGDIFFKFLKNVHAEGMTTEELALKLRDLLEKDYLVNPSVRVTVAGANRGEVVIIGQVEKPGTYPYKTNNPLTLIRLVSLAGGFKNTANINGTKIIRMRKSGEDKTINVKVSKILDGKEDDIELEPSDIVVVPESFF